MPKVELNGYDIQASERLSDEEALELLYEIKKGNKEAKDRFVMANIKLVLSIVQRFPHKQNIEDMFHVGIVGLLKAINGFDPSYNVKFSTYAVPMIMGEIRHYAKDNSGIKVSRSLRDIAYRALSYKQQFECSHDSSPSIMEVASEIDVPVRNVALALEAVSETVSLNDTVFSDGEDKLTLMDQIKDDKETEENLVNTMLLRDGIKNLPDKEKKVIVLRYYIGKTQVEISALIGISQAQVSRLETNAIKRLRDIIVV